MSPPIVCSCLAHWRSMEMWSPRYRVGWEGGMIGIGSPVGFQMMGGPVQAEPSGLRPVDSDLIRLIAYWCASQNADIVSHISWRAIKEVAMICVSSLYP